MSHICRHTLITFSSFCTWCLKSKALLTWDSFISRYNKWLILEWAFHRQTKLSTAHASHLLACFFVLLFFCSFFFFRLLHSRTIILCPNYLGPGIRQLREILISWSPLKLLITILNLPGLPSVMALLKFPLLTLPLIY